MSAPSREEAVRGQAKLALEAVEQFVTCDGEFDQRWQAEDALVAYLDAADAEGYARGLAEGREQAAKAVEARPGADAYADDNRPCGSCCELNAAAIRALSGAAKEDDDGR